MSNIHLSVIVPVYNSASFIERSLFTLDEFMLSLAYASELIIVDDGSEDNTLEVVERWAREGKPYHVQVAAVGSNKGKGVAVATGMFAAHGKFRVFLDADLAYHPSQILRMVEALEDGADVAVACRVHKDSRYTISPAFFHYLYTRHIASRLINFVMRHTVIKDCHDTQAGLKGFTADAARKIFSRQTVYGFPFDIEALFLAQKMGYEVREVPIEFRYFSEPTTVAFLEDSLKMARDIVRIRLNHALGRYNLPQLAQTKLAQAEASATTTLADKCYSIIVNADDFGMTVPVSQGILKCAANGIVRRTSVMANSPEFDASMDEIVKNHTDIGVGLHATLTWGMPLSPPRSIPSLVEKDGRFLSCGKLLLRSLFGLVSEDEAYIELKAQCEKLSRRWPNIGHIDGHHHAHIFPKICKAAERVAREFKIKYVRSPRECGWFSWHAAFFRRLLTRLLPASSPAYWRRRGFVTSDHFGGFSLSAGPRLKERWLEAIRKLPNGTTELMVHPGYPSKNDDRYNKGREEEVAVLTDNALVEKVKFGVRKGQIWGQA